MNRSEDNTRPKKIADDYINGLSITKIQKKYRCGIHKIYEAFRLHNVRVRSHAKITFQEIRFDYDIIRMSTVEIAKKYNMSPSSIWERLIKGGLQLRDRKTEMLKKTTKIPPSEHPKICQKYLENPTLSSSDIAKDYDVHKTTITGILKKYGIQPESHGPRAGNWQGGITPLHTKIRHCEKAVEWRKACMERDGFRCQLTDQQGQLQVHHKKSFSTIFYESSLSYRTVFHSHEAGIQPPGKVFDLH